MIVKQVFARFFMPVSTVVIFVEDNLGGGRVKIQYCDLSRKLETLIT
jgi:hypothetical protein